MKTIHASKAPAETGLRERRKTATRRELILAGRKLFGEKGLYESSIEDLTSRAGIAKGTLYTYFADKDELVRAVASSGFAQLEEHVARRVGAAHDEAAVIRRAVRAHLEFFSENPDLMRVFHQVRGMLKFDRAAWRPLRATLIGYVDALARILARAPGIASLPPARRFEVARLLFGAASGVTSVVTASGSPDPRNREVDVLVQSLAAMATTYISMQSVAEARVESNPARALAGTGRQAPRTKVPRRAESS